MGNVCKWSICSIMVIFTVPFVGLPSDYRRKTMVRNPHFSHMFTQFSQVQTMVRNPHFSHSFSQFSQVQTD